MTTVVSSFTVAATTPTGAAAVPTTGYTSQNDLLLNNLLHFYSNRAHLTRMLQIITGESRISLRIVDWFATNYAKKNYTVYGIMDAHGSVTRFKVYVDYKLKLKAYSKKRFDPFCRWDRINIPYENGTFIETTIGQLNFFKWAIEKRVLEYIEQHYDQIEKDMNARNSTSKRKELNATADSTTSSASSGSCSSCSSSGSAGRTRKKREELSVSASKSIKKEDVAVLETY